MTKGRPATRGVNDAVIIGRKRGCVMKIEYDLESVCDFFNPDRGSYCLYPCQEPRKNRIHNTRD